MKAKSVSREVVFTEAAIKDIQWQRIKKGEFTVLAEILENLAVLPNPGLDYRVCPVECTNREWWRVKDATNNIRMFVTFNPKTLTVHCILRRTENTYEMAELIWRYQPVRTA